MNIHHPLLVQSTSAEEVVVRTTTETNPMCEDNYDLKQCYHNRHLDVDELEQLTLSSKTSTSSAIAEQSANQENKPKRRVRFAENLCEFVGEPAEVFTDQEKADYYYRKDDYKSFEELNALTVQTYAHNNDSPSSYTSMIHQTYIFCVSNKPSNASKPNLPNNNSPASSSSSHHLETLLSHSMKDSPMLRGLEVWSAPAMAEKCRKRKEAQIRAVVHQYHRDDEHLRQTSLALTKPSSQFARCMANAHASSVILEDQETARQEQMEQKQRELQRERRRRQKEQPIKGRWEDGVVEHDDEHRRRSLFRKVKIFKKRWSPLSSNDSRRSPL